MVISKVLLKIEDKHSYTGHVPFQKKETMLEDIGTKFKTKRL